jgi:pilus assembly protein Flp/PilA
MDVWFLSTSLYQLHKTRGEEFGNRALVGPEHREKGDLFMWKWCEAVAQFIEKEDGPTAVEYAVMLALIIVVCLAAITTLGQNANATFNNVALNTAVKTSAS